MYKNLRKGNRQEINEFLRHNEAGINSSRPEVPKIKIWVFPFHRIRDFGRAVFLNGYK